MTMDDILAVVKPHNDKILAEARASAFREALIKLSNEVFGSLPMIEPIARQAMGNTNYSILMQRAQEARDVIARFDPAHSSPVEQTK